MNKLFTVFILVSFGFCAQAQVQSNGTGGGNWSDPAAWQGGVVPDFNSGAITILSGDAIIVDANFTIDQTTVQSGASLSINNAIVLTINNGAGTDFTMDGSFSVQGELILTNVATHAGMTAANTNFLAGSIYRHRFTTTQGVLPLATWDVNSQVSIEGYTSTFTANAGGNWNQNFGNFRWNCTTQTGVSILNGLLTSVNKFEVLSTGTSILRLSVNQNPTIAIAGNIEVGGTSRVEFSTTGTNTVVNVGGNFVFTSTNGIGTRSSLATTGSCAINITGNFSMNAPGGDLRLATGAAGSGTLNIIGNFDLQAGTLTESGTGTANGNINFVGGAIHQFSNSATGVISNTINYLIQASNTLVCQGESRIQGTTNSSLTVDGTLIVQSQNATGAIITGTGNGVGNVRVANRFYNPGSIVEYNGTSAQFMGNGQPTSVGMTTVINNTGGVSQATTTLALLGNLTIQTGILTISNTNLNVDGLVDIQAGSVQFITVGSVRSLAFNGAVNLNGNLVVTSGASNANVVFGGSLSGGGTVNFSGANCNLTINGNSDFIFPLLGTTSLETLTINSSGTTTFNQNLNINTNAGASFLNITDGLVEINGDLNCRDITLTNGSLVTIGGNTALTNTLTITDGNVQTAGTLSVTNDIIITTGSLLANGTVTLTDDLTLEAGTTLSFLDQTLNLNSQINNNGGTFISNSSSTLNVLGTGILGTIAFEPGSNQLGTFLINRATGGTLVTLNSPLTITTAFNLLDGDFLNTSGLDFASGAVLTRNSTASFVATSAIPTGGPYDLIYGGAGLTAGVEFLGSINDFTSNSSGNITVTLSPAGTVIIENDFLVNSGNITLTTAVSNLTVFGNFTHSGGTFNSNNNTLSFGSFTNNGTFNAPSSANTLTITAGNFTNNGTFNANTSTTIFGSSTSILGSANPTFRNITISVGGDLTPPSGATPLLVAGNFTNDGVFNQGTGTVTFSNSVNGTKTISGAQPTRFYNVNIDNNTANPDVSIAGTVNLLNVLTLGSGAILDADGPGGTGVLTLLSSADNPTTDGSIASLLGASAVTGNVTVQRYMAIEGANNARIYRYISSPVQAPAVSQLQSEIPVTGSFTGTSTCTGCGSNQSMFLYNESVITDTNASGGNDFNDGYEDFPNAANSETLTAGRGYSLFVRGNINPVAAAGSAKWDVRAAINSGTINFNAFTTFTSSGVLANDGWNLVGNPFPSTIDWDAASGWTRTGLNNAIYVLDNGQTSPVFATYVGGVGTNGGSRYIATGQAFFVKSDGGPINFQATESVKAAGTQTTFFREAGEKDIIRIALKRGIVSDETIIRFNESATDGFDAQFDAYKLKNQTFNLSSVIGESNYAINALNSISCSTSLKLNISDAPVGTYQLELSQSDSFEAGVEVVLMDEFLGKTIDARSQSSYQFEITTDLKSTGSRFSLMFKGAEINNSIVPESSLVACNSEAAYGIALPTSQSGVSYYATLNGSTISSQDAVGSGSNLTIGIDPSKLSVGDNNIVIFAKRGSCAIAPLLESVNIKYDNLYQIQSVTDGTSCQEGTVLLSATGAQEEGSYKWYEAMESTESISGANGNSFVTPVLNKSRNYFVAAVNSMGCEGERKLVKAEVIQYENVSISEPEYGLLKSTFAEGNVWYFNDEVIAGGNKQNITVDKSGVYKVEISIGSCKTVDSYDFVVTALEKNSSEMVSLYPNPVTTELIINVKGKNVAFINLISNTGVQLHTETVRVGAENVTLDMRSNPAGLYLVKLIGSDKSVSTYKIMKR